MRNTGMMFLILMQAVVLQAQRIREIIVEPDTAGRDISYGSGVAFRFYTVNKKDKKKDVEFRKIDQDVVVSCEGAEWDQHTGYIKFPLKPTSKDVVSAKVTFSSIKPDIAINTSVFEIRMNFKSPPQIFFKGANGTPGAGGDNKGTPLLLRDGKTGDPGGNGGNGAKGPSVTVRLKREMDDFLKREIIFVYAMDDSLKTEYVYRWVYAEKGIDINVSGGDGGAGGKGGDGGTGKVGVLNDKENKRPGDGGNGGWGGNGGNGGDGGNITVIAHTNCGDVLGYLRIQNSGGLAGLAGAGGRAGSAGSAAAGQNAGNPGKAGGYGQPGQPGKQGPPFVLRVEDF